MKLRTPLHGRILIVSGRRDVVAELEPIIRAAHHLAVAVPTPAEALGVLDHGIIPDVVITDPAGPAGAADGFLHRFREMNRVGRHLVVTEDEGAPAPRGAEPLPRPFRPADVTERIEDAVRRIDHDLVALRGEMYRELGRLQRSMRDLVRETVNALAATIAARDPYMHGHSTRVAELCVRVARAMGLEEGEVELLETAATLHEIGKSSVPIELLHKTEPLSPDELARIRAHAKVGAGIVAKVPSLGGAAPIIEHQNTDHVELARRLKPGAPELLLTGILHVVDAYDAMVSARSYRGPMPRDYWEATLRAGAGRTFHPAAVAAFLRVTAADAAGAAARAA